MKSYAVIYGILINHEIFGSLWKTTRIQWKVRPGFLRGSPGSCWKWWEVIFPQRWTAGTWKLPKVKLHQPKNRNIYKKMSNWKKNTQKSGWIFKKSNHLGKWWLGSDDFSFFEGGNRILRWFPPLNLRVYQVDPTQVDPWDWLEDDFPTLGWLIFRFPLIFRRMIWLADFFFFEIFGAQNGMAEK